MTVIGIPFRYEVVEKKGTFYITDNFYKILEGLGCMVKPLLPPKEIIISEEEHPERRYYDVLNDQDKKFIEESLMDVSGVILPGGRVITDFDKYLVEVCLKKNIPLLGICMGMQVICNYNNGGVKVKPVENHSQETPDNTMHHEITIDKDSYLYKLVQKERFMTNSFHRFTIDEKDYFKVVSRSLDNVIEGVEIPNTKIVGVQWHPEISYYFDDASKNLIDSFIKECKNIVPEKEFDNNYKIDFDKYESVLYDGINKYFITEEERKNYINKYKE